MSVSNLTVDELGLEPESEVNDPNQDSFLNQALFDPAKIDIVTQPRSIDVLLSRLKYGEMDLSPDFQRHANLWGEDRKTALIESILLKIPLPSLYVSEDQDGNYAVVDGLQRMSAIAHFVDVDALNKALNLDEKEQLKPLTLNIKGLRSFHNLKGKTFKELERPLQRRILETELTVHVIRSGTPGIVKFNIFSRINQGGLPLTAQEIRHAIYPGRWRDEIKKMVESNEFQAATEGKIQAKRMEDMELMLRVVAIHHQREPRPNDQNLEDHLNNFVEKECQYWGDEKWDVVAVKIKRALKVAPIILGEYAFRKYYGVGEKRKPINRGLFEAQVGVLSRYEKKILEVLIFKKNQVLDSFSKISNRYDYHSKRYPPLANETPEDSFYREAKLFNDLLQNSNDLIQLESDFQQAVTFATSKGWASNKRIEAMEYIFSEALKASDND